MPGVSVAVVGRDGPHWVKGFGLANLASSSPVLPDTAYLWFSMTKIVTATAVLRLVERGRLDLDEPAATHCEPISMLRPSTWARRITIRHLLSHTSGLANPIPIGWVRLVDEPAPDPQTLLTRLLARHSRLRSAPGERAGYSNLGYLVLGRIVASVSGRAYEDVVREEILRPAGMTRTDFLYTPAMGPAAVGYQRRWSPLTPLLRLMVPRGLFGTAFGAFASLNPFYVNGAAYGGLIGPADDVARFLHAHLAGGTVGGWRMLSDESVSLMQELKSRGRKLDVGLGWFRRRGAGPARHGFVEHLGGGGGFLNVMRLYPESALGIVIMGNATSYDIDGIANALARGFWPES